MVLAAKLDIFSVPSHSSASFLIDFRWAQHEWFVFAINSTGAFQKCALDFDVASFCSVWLSPWNERALLDFPGHG